METRNAESASGEKRIYDMTKDEINSLSREEFEVRFRKDRLFTVRDAIAWLSKQNPDAGLMYFEPNSNAWCDMSPDMFSTVADEKPKELEMQRHWLKGETGIEEKIRKNFEEVFRYVKDDDICVQS